MYSHPVHAHVLTGPPASVVFMTQNKIENHKFCSLKIWCCMVIGSIPYHNNTTLSMNILTSSLFSLCSSRWCASSAQQAWHGQQQHDKSHMLENKATGMQELHSPCPTPSRPQRCMVHTQLHTACKGPSVHCEEPMGHVESTHDHCYVNFITDKLHFQCFFNCLRMWSLETCIWEMWEGGSSTKLKIQNKASKTNPTNGIESQ